MRYIEEMLDEFCIGTLAKDFAFGSAEATRVLLRVVENVYLDFRPVYSKGDLRLSALTHTVKFRHVGGHEHRSDEYGYAGRCHERP
jgi:hypothetical protein